MAHKKHHKESAHAKKEHEAHAGKMANKSHKHHEAESKGAKKAIHGHKMAKAKGCM